MFKTGQSVYLLIRSGSRASKAIKDRMDPKQWVVVGTITKITRSSVIVNQEIYFDRHDDDDILHNNEYSLYVSADLVDIQARRKIVVSRLNSIMLEPFWTDKYTVEELEHVLFTLENGVPQQAEGKPASISTFFK